MALSKVSRGLVHNAVTYLVCERETEYVLWCFWQHGNHTQGVLKKRHGFKLCIWSLANCAYNCFFLLGMQQCYNTAAYQLENWLFQSNIKGKPNFFIIHKHSKNKIGYTLD